MDETRTLLMLSLLPRVGPRAVRDLASRAPLAEIVAHPDLHPDLLWAGARDLLKSGEARRRTDQQLGLAARHGLRHVGWDEPDYPGYVREIYDPPPVLYCRGQLRADEGPRSVGIVGSRAASPEGRTLARTLARDLAAVGVTIVSGLARGIDVAAHRGAVEAGGRTVAVLGSGLDRLYPPEHEEVVEALVTRGAVVSEFPLGTVPSPGHFPRRNRVIAGWGRAVVVVEAAERSGALVTARYAMDEGREVCAVPGHPASAGAAGTNRLIRDGAALVRGAADVAQEIGLVIDVTEAGPSAGEDLLDLLRRDAPASLEDLQSRSGRPVPELLARLAELEVADRIRRLPGPLYVRS
jgi:DNA processing protein